MYLIDKKEINQERKERRKKKKTSRREEKRSRRGNICIYIYICIPTYIFVVFQSPSHV